MTDFSLFTEKKETVCISNIQGERQTVLFQKPSVFVHLLQKSGNNLVDLLAGEGFSTHAVVASYWVLDGVSFLQAVSRVAATNRCFRCPMKKETACQRKPLLVNSSTVGELDVEMRWATF